MGHLADMAAGGDTLRLAPRAVVILCALVLPAASLFASPIKQDEEVVFFPTAARLSEDWGHWIVPIHAWVFEREDDSLWRRGTLEALARSFELDESAAESEIFKDRARWFLVDNERDKRLQVTLTEGSEDLGQSGADGFLDAEVRLRRRAATEDSASFWLGYAAVLPAGDDRAFQGEALLVAPEGLSVVSDIDDTIKVSQVTDKKALLANTFLKPFEAVPGMATAYRRLAEAGAVFHYVSSSPWQLYPSLERFLRASAFPRGSFHLRKFRLKDESLFALFKSARATKPPIIEGLLAAYPKREFILIGDSGEEDPEIYGNIARSHPGRIRHIYIRQATPEPPDTERYRAAFTGLPSTLWTVFRDPAVIAPNAKPR
jgi:phosphatidate phosphatase APP1